MFGGFGCRSVLPFGCDAGLVNWCVTSWFCWLLGVVRLVSTLCAIAGFGGLLLGFGLGIV